jgi:putative tricarboxylic transport membrane protein
MNWDRVGRLFLIVLSIIVCGYSIKLKIGSLSNPGSGFVPFVAGALFGLIPLFQILKPYFLQKSRERAAYIKVENKRGSTENRKRMIFVMTSLLAYIILMPKLGYLVSTFLFMSVLFTLGPKMKWWIIMGFSAFISLSTYAVFDRWLSCQFPTGIFG